MRPAGIPTFELGEWKSRLIEGRSLSVADQRLKEELESGEEGRLLVEELRTGVRITARSWVGVVRFQGFEVRVVPKLAGENLGLVEMIEFAEKLDALRRLSSERTLHAEGCGLLDLLALLLVEACEVILRGGLLADYVEREDDLPVVRGRLLGDQQVLRQFGRLDRLACRFDDHDMDIVENQLLAAALEQCAVRVTNESVRRRVRCLLAIFQEVCRSSDLDLEAERGMITYNRLNEHYKYAHELSWLILERLGIKDLLHPGDPRCFAFLIDMNRLFEKFVYRLLEGLLARKGIRVHYQRGDRSIILNAATNEAYTRVVPDLLIEEAGRPAALVAIDAKYKLYDERKLDSGDIYQVFLYAYAYAREGGNASPTALLVYPSSTGTSESVRLRIRNAQGLTPAEIHAVGVPIRKALSEVSKGVPGPASRAIIEAIEQAIGAARPVCPVKK